MGVLDKFLDIMKLSDDDDFEDDDFFDDDYDDDYEDEKPKKGIFSRLMKSDDDDDYDDDDYIEERSSAKQCLTDLTRIIYRCRFDYTDFHAYIVSSSVRRTHRCHFITGSAFAISGNLQKISNYIFLVTPTNVDISGDLQDLLGTSFDSSSMGSRF